jgi:uncharacterized protein YkwD
MLMDALSLSSGTNSEISYFYIIPKQQIDMKKLANFLLMILAVANGFAQSAEEIDLLNALNAYRVKNRLPKVEYSKELSKAARHHATYVDMCLKRGIVPTNHDEEVNFPNWNEYSYGQRSALLRKVGIIVNGEVIQMGGDGGFDIIENGLHTSPPHREIMRKRDNNLVGIGYVGSSTVIIFGI